MKGIFLLCLLSISTINCLAPARDFITSFYNGYKGTNIVLNEKCFGEDFDRDFNLVKQYISERNYDELINILLKLENDLWDSCATDELVAIIDRFDLKVKDGTIKTDLIAKILKIGLHIYRAVKIGAISFENIGDALGRICFTLLSDKTPE